MNDKRDTGRDNQTEEREGFLHTGTCLSGT